MVATSAWTIASQVWACIPTRVRVGLGVATAAAVLLLSLGGGLAIAANRAGHAIHPSLPLHPPLLPPPPPLHHPLQVTHQQIQKVVVEPWSESRPLLPDPSSPVSSLEKHLTSSGQATWTHLTLGLASSAGVCLIVITAALLCSRRFTHSPPSHFANQRPDLIPSQAPPDTPEEGVQFFMRRQMPAFEELCPIRPTQ